MTTSLKIYPTLIATILLYMSSVAGAQPYRSIFGDSVTIHTSTFSGISIGAVIYGIAGDTLVNGISYKKVSITWNDGSGFGIPLGLLREDTIEGKVWYRSVTKPAVPAYNFPARDTIDKLVMDMSLMPGDSFVVGDNIFFDDVVKVDSVYVVNGRKHIVFDGRIPFHHNTTSYRLSFIEGIGTSFGLCYKDSNTLYSMSPKIIGEIICVLHDNTKVYTSPIATYFDGECIPPDKVEVIAPANMTISPNPGNGVFDITLPHKTSKISVTDIAGRIVQDIDVKNPGTIRVDISMQPRGMYLLHVHTDSGMFSEKILIQ